MKETIALLENVMCPEDTLSIHFTTESILIHRIYSLAEPENNLSIGVWKSDTAIDPITAFGIMTTITSLGTAKRFINGARIVIDERICIVNIETLVDALAKCGLIIDMVTHVAGYIIFDQITLLNQDSD
jgi:hypothetical protein